MIPSRPCAKFCNLSPSDKTYQSVATIVKPYRPYDKAIEQLKAAVMPVFAGFKTAVQSNLILKSLDTPRKINFFTCQGIGNFSRAPRKLRLKILVKEKRSHWRNAGKALDESNSSKIINSAQMLLETMVP